jgi:diaminopimelate epimerase
MLRADFVKSHGLGNDYVVVDADRFGLALTPDRVRLLCHRNLGLGSDGVLEVSCRSEGFSVRIWNPDGSQAERSGNGLRIAAKFLSEHGYTEAARFTIGTTAGPVATEVFREAGRVREVRLEMGRAAIDASVRTLDVGGSPGTGGGTAVARETLDVTVLSVGNPHCVVFGQPLTRERLFALGPRVENHPRFPARINAQLAEPAGRDRVRALIWERGAGHTLASGTSACAVAAACVDRGLAAGRVAVEMEGGVLEIEVSRELDLVLKGPVEEVYAGEVSPDLRERLAALP